MGSYIGSYHHGELISVMAFPTFPRPRKLLTAVRNIVFRLELS